MPRDVVGGYSPHSSRLSNDVAREHPEYYKRQLLEVLGQKTVHTTKAWDLYKGKGVFTDDSIVLDTNTWISDTRMVGGEKKIIRLGTQALPAELRSKLLFEDTRFQGEDEIVYRLSHEIGHEVGFDAASKDEGMNRLYSAIAQLREKGKGLSSLGNLDFYAHGGANTQATEDLVELVNMYMIDPEYLERYMHFLSAPSYQTERNRLGLYTFPDARVGKSMLRTIEKGVSSVLGV